MKKAFLVAAGLCVTSLTWAQKQNIQTANNYLRDKDYDKAIEYINMATNDPSTKDNAKTWFVKGQIYMTMQQDPAKKSSNPYREATAAFIKVVELDGKYEKDDVNQALLVAAYNYYNDAVAQYNAKKYDDAYLLAKSTVDIHGLEAGKRFTGNKSFDTVTSQALVIEAFSAFNAGKYDEALVGLTTLKSDPISRDANVYLSLADIYKKQNKDNELLAVLAEGKAQYPGNENIRNEELNYYIKAGKQDILLKKLEEALTKDPNNSELQFNLANIYTGIAYPKDGSKPANYDDMVAKAEGAYLKALSADAANGGYNYNTGVLFYNKATDLNKQMNGEADLSNNAKTPVEKKKHEDLYNQLSAKRDAEFDKAIPYFEKTVAVLEPQKGSLSPDDKFSYQSALIALKEIYARRNNMEKSNEMKKKIEESRKK